MILIVTYKFYSSTFFKAWEWDGIYRAIMKIDEDWGFFSFSPQNTAQRYRLSRFPFIAVAGFLIVTAINAILLWEETNKEKTVLAQPKIDVVINFSVIRMKKCTAAGRNPVFSTSSREISESVIFFLLSGRKHSFKNAFNLVHKNNYTMFIGDEEGDEKEPIDDDYNAKSMLTD